MAKTKEDKTLADYVAIAIGPALIMALVGSLVFFLVAVLYRGEFVGRLNWILFFFVFGAVLIARISMQGEIADRAGLYGIVLGGLVWVALLMYVDWGGSGGLAPYGWLIDLGLIAVTWWCAHRLTWDCTLIDDEVDASGQGLLQVAGLEGKPGQPVANAEQATGEEVKEAPAEKIPGLIGWWERYRRYKEEQQRKPHAPGVWVVYFSLAALPLFGLGQLLMSADDSSKEAVGRRQYAFWLMTVYVGSGLGLLLTTSFLGLRRYLRQRKLQMPAAMTGVWLLVGGTLITALLLLGAFLPRPSPEFSFMKWTGGGGSERQASKLDVKGGTAGKDQGRRTGKQPDKGDRGEKGPDKGEGEDKGQGGDKDGNGRDKDGKGGKDKDKSGKDADGKDSGGKDDSRKGDSGKQQDKDGGREQRNEDQKDGGQKAQDREGQPAGRDKPEEKDKGSARKENGKPEDSSPKPPSQSLPEITKKISNVLKWIVAGIVAVLVIFFLLRSGLKFLANFTHWAKGLLAALRALWEGLWGWGSKSTSEEEAAEEAEAARARPFASFRDPFLSGEAEGMSHGQLVRYSFEALQAWAQERELGRQVGETPFEFARRIGSETPALEEGALRLANYYVTIAYARGSLTRACREPLRQFWQTLAEVVERPMSAGVGASEPA
jgi:hypothetical protein